MGSGRSSARCCPCRRSAGAKEIVSAIRRRWSWLKHLFGDGAYNRTKLLNAAAFRDFTVEIIHRSDDVSGFKALRRRWVVERTFGWMMRWRRLVRDYGRLSTCRKR